MMTPLEYISREDAMRFLGVKGDWLIEQQQKGMLPFYKVGRKVFYKISEVNAMIRHNKVT